MVEFLGIGSHLSPPIRTVVKHLIDQGFCYEGYYFDSSVETTYKGWIIEATDPGCEEFVEADPEEKILERNYITVVWANTLDCWRKYSDEEFGFNTAKRAIATVEQLIDRAEIEHNLSPGQLSLF